MSCDSLTSRANINTDIDNNIAIKRNIQATFFPVIFKNIISEIKSYSPSHRPKHSELTCMMQAKVKQQ